MSDGKGHGQHREPKGQRDTGESDAQVRKRRIKYRRVATAKNQPEGTKTLCQ
jgi:hypothetical protein